MTTDHYRPAFTSTVRTKPVAHVTSPTPEREHFIPLRADDLAHLLASSELIEVGQQHDFLDVCRILKSVFHFEYHEELLRLKNTYAPFDPDTDTVSLRWSDEDSNTIQSDALFESLVHMFERANFRRLNRDQLEKAFEVKSAWGLNLEVDFDIFDRLELFARGEAVVQRDHRDWRNWYRVQKKDVLVHQRLVVAFKLRNGVVDGAGREGVVTLKIFKEIPKGDLEMLLPGTRVQMTLLDRCLLYTSPSPRDKRQSRMPSSA